MEAASRKRLAAFKSKYGEHKSSQGAQALSGHDLAPTNWTRRLLAFGGGGDGQLGCSALLDSSRLSCLKTPCWVSLEAAEGAYDANRKPKAIACGSQVSLANMSDGKVFVWGSGLLGCEGGKRRSPRSKRNKTRIPRCIASLSEIKSVAVGYQDHCLALARDGFVYSWGPGSGGRLGHGDMLDQPFPKKVEGLYSVVEIEAGEMHSMALNQRGVLYTWGSSKGNQLGHGSKDNDSDDDGQDRESILKPRALTYFQDEGLFVLQIACGMNHNAVIAAAQGDVDKLFNNRGDAPSTLETALNSIDSIMTSLYTWGYGEHGRLGNGLQDESCSVPTLVKLSTSVRNVSAGASHTVVVTSVGEMLGWGNNEFGQVGVEESYNERAADGNAVVLTPSPVRIPEGVEISDTVASVKCGYAHSAAISTNGSVYVWGWNEQGQLGLGDEISRYQPCHLDIVNCVRNVQLSLGRAHTSIIVERVPGESVDALNESSGIKSNGSRKKVDPIAKMREEKERKKAKKLAKKKAKLEKKRALAAAEEAARQKEMQLLKEQRENEAEEKRLAELKIKEEEEERRRAEIELQRAALEEMERARVLAERVKQAKLEKEKRLFDEKVKAERRRAEAELEERRIAEEKEKEAARLRQEQVARAERARQREEEERQNRLKAEEERIRRKKERLELDRLKRLEEEALQKKREEAELLKRKMLLEAENARKKEQQRLENLQREKAAKEKAEAERKERERVAAEKNKQQEETRKKREMLFKEAQEKKRKEREVKRLVTLRERAEREKAEAEKTAREKAKREELTAARKMADRKRRAAEKKKKQEEEQRRQEEILRKQKLREEEKARRKKAAAEMKKKRQEKSHAMEKYESELRGNLEAEVKRRNDFEEKMRKERLQNARARRKEKEALHKLLISTYRKSEVRVKAELDGEEEKKRKRREEAAAWMKKKWREAKKGAKKTQKEKRKAKEAEKNRGNVHPFPENLSPEVVRKLQEMRSPPPTAPTSSNRKRIRIERQLRPASSHRRY